MKHAAILIIPVLAVALPSAAPAQDGSRGDMAVTAVRGGAAVTARQRVPAMAPLPADPLPYRQLSLRGIDDVEVGVGLFSVGGATEKELVRRRTDPSRDAVAGRSRLAGAGLRLSF
jgi:hypothetical protein